MRRHQYKSIRVVNNWKRYSTWGRLVTETDQKRADLILAAFPKLRIGDWIQHGKESPRNLHVHTLLIMYGDLLDTLEYCEQKGIVKLQQEPDRMVHFTFESVAQACAYRSLFMSSLIPKTTLSEHKSISLRIQTSYNDHLYRFEDLVGTCHSARAASYLSADFKTARLRIKVNRVKQQIEKKIGGSIALLDTILNNTQDP